MMRLTIIGFGNQAKSWALNLRDSGFPVRIALRKSSSSMSAANTHGLEVVEIGSTEFYSDQCFALLTPDNSHQNFLAQHGSHFSPGTVLLYAHGFSMLKFGFEKKFPHLRHVLFAPKSIGTELRQQFLLKGKLGAVFSLEHVADDRKLLESWLRELARALGINMGPYGTSFRNETQADLFSEQGLLCTLVPYAASEMFSLLVKKGIEPELAYFECWHELKLIVQAMVDAGPQKFFDLISPNALIGAEKGYQKLFSEEFHRSLESLFSDIQTGKFEQEIDGVNVEELRARIKERWRNSPLQHTANKLRQEQS